MDYTASYNYQMTPDAGAVVGAGMLAFFGGLMLIWLVFILAIYAYMAVCLMIIAKKTNTANRWFAWIPILNLILMIQVAKRPLWWIVLFFIPLANLVAMVILWMDIAVARNKPNWLGILMIVPVANL